MLNLLHSKCNSYGRANELKYISQQNSLNIPNQINERAICSLLALCLSVSSLSCEPSVWYGFQRVLQQTTKTRILVNKICQGLYILRKTNPPSNIKLEKNTQFRLEIYEKNGETSSPNAVDSSP